MTSLNVTMRAGERRAMFSMGIIADFILERRESFQCTVSKIHTPLQVIPIEWDQVPATVIIDDLIFTTIFIGNYSSVVLENVSHVPITIETFDIAEFEYTIDLYVDNGSTAKGMLQSPVYKALHLVYLSTSVFDVICIDHSFVRSNMSQCNLLLSYLAIIAWWPLCNPAECCLLTVMVLRTSEMCMTRFHEQFFLFYIQHRSDAVCTSESISIVRGQ